MRGDMVCFHEPFGEPGCQGEEPLWPRVRPDSPRISGLTFDSVWDELQSAARKGPIFCKDFPHYVEHLWSNEFLYYFTHSFLIRDPVKVTTSMYKHWPDFVLKEIAFVEQLRK